MSAEAIGALVFFGVVFGLGLLCFVLCEVMNFIDKKRNERHHKEHPEFFRLREDFSEKANMACRFHNKEIAPRKNKVDYMLRDEPYWPQEVREQKMEELEKLRREIYTAELMDKTLSKETMEARQRVADYVHAHNIKWGGDWD